MYYDGGGNKIHIGRNKGKGAIGSIALNGKSWPALGDIYCNVGGVGAGRISSSCTSRDQRAQRHWPEAI